jgi:lipopolysaccharide biosynthesis glycosyltransferase
MDQIRLFVGKDPRETVGYHVFLQSVLSKTDPNRVSITALTGEQGDASNTFSKARFHVPELCGYMGWALWMDGSDMLCRADLQELWALRESGYDVMVVKHDYKTKHATKYLGQINLDYERKNWSSVMLLNCGNAVWRRPAFQKLLEGPAGPLHRLSFLEDERIGYLPKAWNHLVSEYQPNPQAKLAHMTIGLPCWYPDCEFADEWRSVQQKVNYFEPWLRDGHSER